MKLLQPRPLRFIFALKYFMMLPSLTDIILETSQEVLDFYLAIFLIILTEKWNFTLFFIFSESRFIMV
jgi:hypothetical protein